MNHGTEAFWLLTEPFEADPDARFLIPTRPVRALLGGLRDALSSRPGWIVVVGEPGVGKSVLVRMLVESLGDHAPIAVIPDASVDFADLREQLDARLGERGAPVTTDTLLRLHRAGRRPLVVLDGAEELTDEAARDLDAMFAAPIEARPVALLVDLIAVVDTAPDAPLPEWARTRRPVKLVLGRLDAADTAEYVRRRVRLAAGGERDLFDAGALDEVFRRTAGRPDAINRLCGLALDRVAAAGHSRVGSEDVRGAAALLGDLVGDVQLALAMTDPIAPASAAPTDRVAPRMLRPPAPSVDRAEHPPATHASAPRPTPHRADSPSAPPQHAARTPAWKLGLAVGVGCVIGVVLTLWLDPRGDGPSPKTPVVVSSEPSPGEIDPSDSAVAPTRFDGPNAPGAASTSADVRSAAPAGSADAVADVGGEHSPQVGPSSDDRDRPLPMHPEAVAAPAREALPTSAEDSRPAGATDPVPILSLPPVAAPPPPQALSAVEVGTEPAPAPTFEPTRLPVRQAAPILARAFGEHAAPGTAWSVTLLDGSAPIERAELAHAEFDGRIRTLASVEGVGDRRSARVLDEGSDATGETARVYWPEDRVMRSVAADDPFAGTGFRFADFRVLRAADFAAVELIRDQRDGEPVFVVRAVRAGPDPGGPFDFVIGERDARLLEIREHAGGSASPGRRVLMPRPGSRRSMDGGRHEEWQVFAADGREVGRARIEIHRLAPETGPDLFTFSRLSDPAFSVPKR
jgi:type II secretory pathway predicted ATPase ExeA